MFQCLTASCVTITGAIVLSFFYCKECLFAVMVFSACMCPFFYSHDFIRLDFIQMNSGGGPKLPQRRSGLVVALLYGLGQRRDEVVVEVGAHAWLRWRRHGRFRLRETCVLRLHYPLELTSRKPRGPWLLKSHTHVPFRPIYG